MANLGIKYKALVIGASAGGFEAISTVISGLSIALDLPIILVQHISSHDHGNFARALAMKLTKEIHEVEDKDSIIPGMIYTAPGAYHLLVNNDLTFSLSLDLPVNYSRPSIDVLFESAADIYGDKLIAVLLTGANQDGARGLLSIQNHGGLVIVENPETAQVRTMPDSGLRLTSTNNVLDLKDIASFIESKCNLISCRRVS